MSLKKMSMQADQNMFHDGAKELKDLKYMTQYDIHIFSKRLQFIKRRIEVESEPMRQVSREHNRTNKNGVSLDYLEKVG